MNEEHPFIKKMRLEQPELFMRKPFIENADELSHFGIFIPGKESFTEGYIKLFPEDFIVEEIDAQGIVRTIDRENVLSADSAISGQGETIYATLVKCGLSTLEVVRELSQALKISEKSIGYAGIKDKYAITAQRISIRDVSIDVLKKINSPRYFFKDIEIGKGAIGMANLKGNRFSLYVRTPQGSVLPEIAGSSVPFFNYFYLQRFGSPRFINYLWGYEILRGNYEHAVKSVLFDERPRETPIMNMLRREAKKHSDWKEIMSIFEPALGFMYSEKPMLEHLITNPTDYKGALNRIPDQVQLWLYGLASLLFNEKIAYSAKRGIRPAQEIPFFLSNVPQDIDLYRQELQSLGIFPPPWNNIRPFPFIRLSHRTARAVETASNLSLSPTKGGFLISFNLPKGSYATTFISHYINIIADAIPQGISTDRIDQTGIPAALARIQTIELFRNIPDSSTAIEE